VAMKLVIGNKNYSSWSLRPWILMRQFDLPFEEIRVRINHPETKSEILRYSPSGRVPVLLDGGVTVWDSLAIAEYLAEKFPERGLWPREAPIRAHARSVACEMHSGFSALRQSMPMNCRADAPGVGRNADCLADIARIQAIWRDCRTRHAGKGPFLYGAFSVADAMFAPVVIRFTGYRVDLEPLAQAYCETLWSLPTLQEWVASGREESYRIEAYESLLPL